jgi:hypothetical protein
MKADALAARPTVVVPLERFELPTLALRKAHYRGARVVHTSGLNFTAVICETSVSRHSPCCELNLGRASVKHPMQVEAGECSHDAAGGRDSTRASALQPRLGNSTPPYKLASEYGHIGLASRASDPR